MDPGSGAFLPPASGTGKTTRIRIRDEQPRSYFRELRKIFWVKILKFFDRDPGYGMEKIRIRDKHYGSATRILSVHNRKVGRVIKHY